MADYAGLIMQAFGGLRTAQGQQAAGDADLQKGMETQQLDNYIAQQYRVNAGQAVALGTQKAAIQDIQTKMTMSRALAVAAAGGGGVTDPGIITQISKLAGYGAYAKQVQLYNGEEESRADLDKANAADMSGKIALQGGQEADDAAGVAASGTIMKGASSLFSKYAAGGPKQPDAPAATGGWNNGYDLNGGGALN